MITRLLTLALAAALLFATSARADFINSDLNPGDGLTVTDTVTGNVWLDLSQTAGLSIQSVTNQLSTTFAGWRLAQDTEVLDLFQRLFPSLSLSTTYSYHNPVQTALYTTFSGLFGNTLTGGTSYSMGLFSSEGGVKASGLHMSTYARLTNFINVSSDPNVSGPTYGVFLIQDNNVTPGDVSAPVGALAFSGLILMGLRLRKRNTQ